jgi:hypothetical protein
MNIIDVAYKWNGMLTRRTQAVNTVVVHHSASILASPEEVHRWHQEKGWVGIGYHFLVRKDGNIYRGRPLDAIGAHVYAHNEDSIGVCFEGNFEVEQMTEAQIKLGVELLKYLKTLYPKLNAKKHKDYGGSNCPGKNFNDIIISEGMRVEEQKHWCEEIFNQLKDKGIVINEKRFDDKITRAEVFALLLQIINKK